VECEPLLVDTTRKRNDDLHENPNWFLLLPTSPGATRLAHARLAIPQGVRAGTFARRDVRAAISIRRGSVDRPQQEIQSGGGTAYILEIATRWVANKANDATSIFDRTPGLRGDRPICRRLRGNSGRSDENEAGRRLAAVRREAAALQM